MKTARERLQDGDFNDMYQERQPDGSIDIILSKRGEATRYRLVVKNLYQPNEVVLSDEIVKEK